MKMNFLFLIVPFFYSCFPQNEQVILLPNKEKLIGNWQEIGPKTILLDSLGNFIDSVDENATYSFKDNYTFNAVNDFYLNAEEGTWASDSSTNKLFLYPNVVIPIISGQRNHSWQILVLDSVNLEVNHFYEYNFNGDTIGTFYFRRFVKI